MAKKEEVKLPKPVRAYFIIKNPIEKAPELESKIELSEKDKAARQADWVAKQLKNVQELEVLAVGPDVVSFKVGDKVKISTNRVLKGEALLEDKYFIHSEADVLAVY